MNPEILPATPEHRTLLRNLFELYSHDFSEMNGADVEADGRYTPDGFLAGWWELPGGFEPFLLRVDGQWAGFAFVSSGSYIAPGNNVHWLMDEFFILRKYRHKGLGAWFAGAIFKRKPGTWEIGQIPENIAATAFWHRVLDRLAPGQYDEVDVNNDAWQGVVQIVQIDTV